MDWAATDRLWEAYMGKRTIENRNALVVAHIPVADRVAGWFARTQAWRMDDIRSFSYIGLIDAVEKFDPDRGIRFTSYASYRIRGAITDQIRKEDWITRQARARKDVKQTKMTPLSFIEGFQDGKEDPKSGREIKRIDDMEEVKRILDGLCLRERMIMRKRFLDGKKQKKIGEEIGVSESRVNQVLSKTLVFLREWVA